MQPGITEGLAAAEVLRVLAALDAVGLRTWVAGGWGVDALVGRETRMHRDLDVTHAPLEQALTALERLDYGVETDWLPSRVELAAPSDRWVDVHPVVIDDEGTGWQVNVADLPPLPLSASCLHHRIDQRGPCEVLVYRPTAAVPSEELQARPVGM